MPRKRVGWLSRAPGTAASAPGRGPGCPSGREAALAPHDDRDPSAAQFGAPSDVLRLESRQAHS